MTWIYDTSVPGVYITPEKPGPSYGNEFAKVVVDAYKTFCYLYGVSTMSTISIPEQEKEEAYQWMKAIIPSLLFRNSMLEAKDGGRIRINSDKNIKMVYEYDTGMIKAKLARKYEISPMLVYKYIKKRKRYEKDFERAHDLPS